MEGSISEIHSGMRTTGNKLIILTSNHEKPKLSVFPTQLPLSKSRNAPGHSKIMQPREKCDREDFRMEKENSLAYLGVTLSYFRRFNKNIRLYEHLL